MRCKGADVGSRYPVAASVRVYVCVMLLMLSARVPGAASTGAEERLVLTSLPRDDLPQRETSLP